ncbi:CRISPR-associated endonuclease Cas9 [compost metagenome]
MNNSSAKVEDLKNEERKKKQIEQRNKLKNSLCFKTKPDENGNYKWVFEKPWDNFTVNAKNELERVVVSFKQNLRVINRATNHYEKIDTSTGPVGKKVEVEQKGVNWAIRKTMHKEFVYAKVDLPWVKVGKREILTAIRKSLDVSFDEKKIETSITDTGIQKILLAHLEKYKGRKDENGKDIAPETLAFTPEGIEEMNKNIIELNKGKFHQPIFKVRVFEKGTGRFAIGQKGNKKVKYVEAAKGTNLFFVVYERKDTKTRMFDTVPLNEVIEHQKLQVATSVDKSKRTDVPIKNVLEYKGKDIDVAYLFHLSPNDLVYVPTIEEQENSSRIDFGNLTKEQRNRIYKFTDGSGVMANFIPANIASVLFNMNKDKQKKAFGKESFSVQNEIGVGSQGSKNENAITGEQVKSVCIKLKIDRLGNISKV